MISYENLTHQRNFTHLVSKNVQEYKFPSQFLAQIHFNTFLFFNRFIPNAILIFSFSH